MALITKTDLLALLPDNITGEISPADVREIVNNVLGGYGGMVHSESGVGTQTISTTFVKVQQWEFATPSNGIVADVSGVNSGTITVPVDGDYEVHYDLDFIGSPNLYHLHLYKNDELIHPQIGTSVKGAADPVNVSFNTIVTLSADDELSIYINCAATNKLFDIEHGQLLVKRIG